MCDPTSITALALAAAGTYASYEGAQQTKHATEDTQEAEATRQKGYADKSRALFDQSLNYNQADAQQGREQSASDKLNALYQDSVDNTLGQMAPMGANVEQSASDTPKIIADNFKNAIDLGKSRASAQLRGKAALGGFDDMLAHTKIQDANIANEQGIFGNFMRGSANVVPIELQAASHAGDSAKNWGAALSAASSIVGGIGTAAALKAGAGTAAGATAAESAAAGGTTGAYTAVNPATGAIMYRPPV